MGTGEEEVARLNGLGTGNDEETDREVRPEIGMFCRYVDGGVSLKLWPVSRSAVLVLAFHRGRLIAGVVGIRLVRDAGVGVVEEYGGECTDSAADDLRLPVAAVGMPDNRRELAMAERDVLPTELPRLLDPPFPALGVRSPPV